MVRNKLAIPAAAIVLLTGTAGLGQQAGSVHAKAASADYSGSVAITDYQFPVSTGLGGSTTASVANVEVAGALFDSAIGLDAKGNFFPDLVTEVPTTKNGGIKVVGGNEVVTYHIKPNLKFSDGSPIDKTSFIAPLVMDFAPEVNNVDPLQKIKTISFSGNDMSITYKGIYSPAISYGFPGLPNAVTPLPVAYFEKKYGGQFPKNLLNDYNYDTVQAYYKSAAYKGSSFQSLVNKWLNDAYISPNDVFNGPYKIGEWTQDQRIVLVPNTFYTALPPDPKHPRPAKIQFVLVSTSAPAVVQAMAADQTYNQIDKAEDFTLADVPALKKSKYQILIPDALQYEHLELNVAAPGNPALRDVRVRQALSYAIDKQKYLEADIPGVPWDKIALTSPLPGVSPWSINKELPKNQYDLAKAKSLIAAAGYSTSLTGPGKHLLLKFSTTTKAARVRSSQILQRFWAQIGVALKIQIVPAYGSNGNGLFDSYQDGGILARHLFDIAEFAFSTSPDPDQSVQNFLPVNIGNATHPAGVNYIQVQDPKLVSFFDKARVTLDDAQRQKYYSDFQRYMIDQAYNISLYNNPNVLAYKGTIGNFKPNATQAGNTWNAFEWWVDPSGSQKAAS